MSLHIRILIHLNSNTLISLIIKTLVTRKCRNTNTQMGLIDHNMLVIIDNEFFERKILFPISLELINSEPPLSG